MESKIFQELKKRAYNAGARDSGTKKALTISAEYFIEQEILEELTPKGYDILVEEYIHGFSSGVLQKERERIKKLLTESVNGKPLNFVIGQYTERKDVTGLASFFRAYIDDLYVGIDVK